jgi:hypothetical protein
MNTFALGPSKSGMKRSAETSWPGALGVALLIMLTVFVIAVRPLTRHNHLARSLGLNRLGAFEPDVDHDPPLPSLAATAIGEVPVLALSFTGPAPVVFKTRWISRRVVPLRRLRLPPRNVTESPSSD